jgi:hypothetical protein
METTQAPTTVVILKDQSDNYYAFSPEQLAEAKVSGDAVADLAVRSEPMLISADLNQRPGARW